MLARTLRRLADGSVDLTAVEAEHEGRSLTTRADQLVYSELDPMTEVYLLTAGMVRLFTGEGAGARTTLLLTAPALFGDRDILAGCAVSQESARSVSKASLLCFDRSDLEEAFAGDAEVRAQLTRDLLVRYARSIRFAGYLALPLEQRILHLLHEQGSGDLPPYENLALMTDSAPKSVGRAIKKLQDDGLLALGSGRSFELEAGAREELAASGLLGLFHHVHV